MSGHRTKAALADAGLEHLMKLGFAATGVADVATSAGVPKGSFYYYYPKKEMFACDIIDRFAARNAERRQALLFGDVTQPALVRLKRYLEASAANHAAKKFAGGCLLGNMSAEVADQSEAVRGRLSSAFSAWQTMIAQVLAEAIACRELDSGFKPERLAAFVVNGWEGALIRMKAEKSREPLDLFISVLFESVLRPPRENKANSTSMQRSARRRARIR